MSSLLGPVLKPIAPGTDAAANPGAGDAWSDLVPLVMSSVAGSGAATYPGRVPSQEAQRDGAGLMDAVGLLWFEAAHLLPRLIQDMGHVISDQTIDCELYNADRQNAITVQSITDNLGSGMLVTGVPSAPFDIGPQTGIVFSVFIANTGDSTIAGTYTLTLSTGEKYTLYFTGTRIILLPVRPEAPLREHLIFDTKIIEAADSSEQRIANRQYPRGMFEATFKGGQRKVEMILFDRQAKAVGFPAWHEPAFLATDHSAGVLTVNVNTTDYANFFVGGNAVIVQDENTYDALTIESMTATSITFESVTTNNYSRKAEVMPLLTAYIEASTASIKYLNNQQFFNTRIHTHPEINDIADDSAWSVYDGKPFLDGPNVAKGKQLSEAIRTKVFVLDNISGLRTPMTQWDHGQRHSKKGWKTNTRQELWELRQLLHFLKGKQVSFYIPTFWKDLIVVEDMAIGTFVLNIEHIGYTINARQRWPKQVIRIIFNDGTILVRTIQNSSELSSVQEQLTLDIAWPDNYVPDDVSRVEFLEKVRLAVDDIVITHYNAIGQSECILPIREVVN